MFHKSYVLIATAVLLFSTGSCDTEYRINSPLTPIHYSIIITPYFKTGDALEFTFNGVVNLTFETNEANLRKIRLHSDKLKISASNITLRNDTSLIGLHPVKPLEFIRKYSFMDINLESPLKVGVRYTLHISYKGLIGGIHDGFFRNSYQENGVTKWLGATLLEAVNARNVFPCLDEPQYKAKFSLSIDRPANFSQNLANTKWERSIKLNNGYIRDVFAPTPKMSTYLVAFTISEFVVARQSVNGTREFGIITRKEASNQSDYTFDIGMRVEAAMSEYFGIDYYSTDENLKLDHIGVIRYAAGAMENWGLVIYGEPDFLYVPEVSVPYYKYAVASLMAHETTHMWFGNLVTCHWWSDVWLNEGFANYFQNYIPSLIEPDLGSANKIATGSAYAAYIKDEVLTPLPISNNDVNSPLEIANQFSVISYDKAGSIIRMIHHFIGDEAFRTGLNIYLNNNTFSMGTPELLYAALQQGVDATGSLADYPGVSVAQVMGSWITQPGHPILNVDVNYTSGNVILRQERFYSKPDNNRSSNIYAIPITYKTQEEANFTNTKPAFVMEGKEYVFNLQAVRNNNWIIFNVQETGFYRVNYDATTWKRIAEALKGDERDKIHELNRAKIVNDLFAFLTAKIVDMELVVNVLDFLRNEINYSVWLAATNGLHRLTTMFFGTDAQELINTYNIDLMENVIKELGYEERPEDDFVTLENRDLVLYYACWEGHKECIQNAVKQFQDFRHNGTRVKPSLKRVVYCMGLWHGNNDDYNFLQRLIKTENVANARYTIYSALACSKSSKQLNDMVKGFAHQRQGFADCCPECARRTTISGHVIWGGSNDLTQYLESVTLEASPLPGREISDPVSSVVSNPKNVDLVLNLLKAKYADWNKIFPSMEKILASITAALHTSKQFHKFESWLASCSECSKEVIKTATASLSKAKEDKIWARRHASEVLRSLRMK